MDVTLYRNAGESQLDFVRRMLHERGSITVREAIYGSFYRDGEFTSLTRLGARIWDLRKEGMVITENRTRHGTAEYVLVSTPHQMVIEGESSIAHREIA